MDAQQKEIVEALRRRIRELERQKEAYGRAMRNLMETHQVYCTLVENQTEGIGAVDLEERFIMANPAAEKLFGVPPGELLGRPVSEFLDEKNLARAKKHTQEYLLGKTSTYELEITRPDGTKQVLLTTVAPHLDSEGKVVGSVAIFRDSTELSRTEEPLRDVFESITEGVLAVDMHGRTVMFNRRFAEMWQISPDVWASIGSDEILSCIFECLEKPERMFGRNHRMLNELGNSSHTLRLKDGRTFGCRIRTMEKNQDLAGLVFFFREAGKLPIRQSGAD
jgi:PAS domain S-box-containing protein